MDVKEVLPIHIVAISGSLRTGGNTDQAVEYAAAVAVNHGAAFTPIRLADYNIHPCGTCGDCNSKKTPCELQDDMPRIIDVMLSADGLIYAAPVYGFGLAHLMQIFIERSGVCYLKFKRPLANKVGGVIVTGRRYNHGQVYSQIIQNLLLNRMILVGSGFPAIVHAGKLDEAKQDMEGMASIRQMVTRMIDMISLIKHQQQSSDSPLLQCLDDNEQSRYSVLEMTTSN